MFYNKKKSQNLQRVTLLDLMSLYSESTKTSWFNKVANYIFQYSQIGLNRFSFSP